MGKALIIAEKPSVAGDIAKALGGFKQENGVWVSDSAYISNAFGHLVRLHGTEADTGGKTLDTLPVIPAQFALLPIDSSVAQYKKLVQLLKLPDVDTVINACDAGREGELIFRLIYEAAGCRKPIQRMWLQSMSAKGICQAHAALRPGAEYDTLYDSARSRSEADWLVGINVTRGVSKLHELISGRRETMPGGRVQTPVLTLLVQREREILSFVSQPYWEINATLGAAAGSYRGKWCPAAAIEAVVSSVTDVEDVDSDEEDDSTSDQGSRLFDRNRAQAIVAKCQGVAPTSVRDQSRVSFSAPPLLFDITTLQRAANKLFRFSAKKTESIAQALYDKHKVTTYPRTDADALPEDYPATVKEIMQVYSTSPYAKHAKDILQQEWIKPGKPNFDDSRVTDHFAIIPTGVLPQELSADEQKIYDLIVRRFMAAFYPPAEFHLTTRLTVIAGEYFKSSGRVMVKSGWREVYGALVQEPTGDGDKAVGQLCLVQPGEAVRNEQVALQDLKTLPPTRYTEAALLKVMSGASKLVDDPALRAAMKERGLGTAATRGTTIEGLLQDKTASGTPKEPYARREGKKQFIVPTKKGSDLITFLETAGLDMVTSPNMTGDWERKLLLIEKGKYRRAEFMAEIAEMSRRMIDILRTHAAAVPKREQVMLASPCPRCGAPLASHPRAISCSCDFKLWRELCKRSFSDAELNALLKDRELPEMDGFVSAKTGKTFRAAIKLTVGDEVKLDFVFAPAAPAAAPGTGIACPTCQTGVLTQRPGKNGKFWGCSRYRDGCKATFNDVKGKPDFSKLAGGADKPPTMAELDAARNLAEQKGMRFPLETLKTGRDVAAFIDKHK